MSLCLAATGYPVAANFSPALAQAGNLGAPAARPVRPAKPSTTVPIAYVNHISKLLRLNPCDPRRSPVKPKLYNSSADVGNPAVSCTIWARPDNPVVIFSSSVVVEGARLPVVVYFNSAYLDRAPDSFVIYTVGGPGGDISPVEQDYLPLALVRSGVVLVKLGYTGTSHGTVFPRPNFELAVGQVRAYSRAVRAENPSGKLILLGESLGGPIVAKAAASTHRLPIDGLALVIPMLFTPDEAVTNFRHIIIPSGRPGAGDLRVRTIKSPSNPWTGGRVAPIASADLFASFFPPETRGRDLGSYLAQAGNIKTLLAFGDSDQVVGLSKLNDASLNAPNIRKLRLRAVPHRINSYSASQVADEILDYLL